MSVERTLPFLILATVALSGLLLGMGQGDFEPFFVAVLGVSASMILVDWLKWFRLPNWVANLLAVLVTILTVSNFYFTNDSVRHLLGVGKLLVYLQTILTFQKKSARVYWQVMVLSLLQIVVGAVFNLGFEGGVLFIIYMMIAGVTMMVLHLYQDRQLVKLQNEASLRLSNSRRRAPEYAVWTISTKPALQRGVLRRMVVAFLIFASGALFFSVLLFYFLPRDNTSWAGPKEMPMQATGFDEKVSMNHSDLILLSSKLQMNVRYWYSGDEQKTFQPSRDPYLRGMALSNLEIDGNRTKWVAPPYQIYPSDFRPLKMEATDRWVTQEIVLEPTDDPLLYTAMPPRFTSVGEFLTDYEWCWPLGALTRQRSAEKITVSHFRYRLKIPILSSGEFFSAYPYVARDGLVCLTEEQDPGNYKWYTYLDRERYPTLVQVAGEIGSRVTGNNHNSIARQMEAYFKSGQFSYTLDYRDIDRDEALDSVEDFFANHRSGHCEYYASALALMLRSQGIPSRLVVGYRGGDINGFGGHLDVEAQHAHAWVEAYIRPEDCSNYLMQTGQANETGAWLRLDPTPSSDTNDQVTSADEALDFAKSLWRDYVLGLQADTQTRIVSADQLNLSGALRVLDLDWWQNSLGRLREDLQEPNGWKRYAVPGFIIIMLALGLVIYLRERAVRQNRRKKTEYGSLRGVRRGIARALNLVSPKLSGWVVREFGGRADEVPFYRQMLEYLEQAGFHKLPQQTHREFAESVAHSLPKNEPLNRLGTLTKTITDSYYLVRFGHGKLDDQQTKTVEIALHDLQELLQQTANS
ncbi:MAG: transglutaminaseTgpA domain-containing protein [Pirellulaceae bacterium]|nr:transglutaminaseTgpA domain-containing protein [Pirellulaceae bacterium]